MRKVTILLFVALICECFSFAQTFVYNELNYTIISEEEKTVAVTSGNDITGEVIIPSSVYYNDSFFDVTCIGAWAFYYCTELTSITIPEGVTDIEDFAFCGCSGLQYISIPNSVVNIESDAFGSCKGLKSIIIPEGVIKIGYDAFGDCTGLTSITIPESVTNIGAFAFYGCTGLTSINVNQNNPVYDSRNDCNAIIQSSTNTIVMGCSTTVIPEGVTGIGSVAFGGCTELKSITIPESVTNIEIQAFYGCIGLTSINVDQNNPVYDSRNNCNAIILSSTNTIVVGCSNTVFPKGVTGIGYCAFGGCTGLTSISIPEGIINIGEEVFNGCTELTSITIPKSVTSIGNGAFHCCTKLTSIEIPEGVTSIGEYAFSGCTNLKFVTIPEGVSTINYGTFWGCDSLSYLSLPSTIETFGKEVFTGCKKLQTAGPKGGGYNYEFSWKDTIPANAFRGLNNLRSVYIPKTIKAIYECDVQANTAINNSAYNAPNSNYYDSSFSNDCGSVGTVFYGCDSLQSVAVSFKNTKLIQLWRDEKDRNLYSFRESPMDFNLYKLNSIQSITILDDSINNLSSVLTQTIKEIILSEYVKHVDLNSFDFTPYSAVLDRFYYDPESIYSLIYSPRNYDLSSNLEKITVESGNSHYSSVDGVLLNKNGSRLLLCPSKRKGGYHIPETVVTVDATSFKGCKDLNSVIIPSSVELIGERAFEGCDSLDWIIFEGSPEIGLNAFNGCQNIRSVTAHSYVPGMMDFYDSLQTIMVGDYEQIATDNRDFIITPIYNDSLERTVTNIRSRGLGWECLIRTDDVASGHYKVSVGILPSTDGLPCYFHPVIYGYTKEGLRQTIFNPGQKIGRKYIKVSYSNDVTGYDSIEIAEALTIPEDFDYFEIGIQSSVNNDNKRLYSNSIVLDRIFFEPIGDDLPENAYAGPFTQKVFNNAMLYVPEGAVSTYQAAAGWKLFKNICIHNAVDPIRLDDMPNEIKDRIIYDSMGRKVEAESIEQLAPGLYIIGSSTFLIE